MVPTFLEKIREQTEKTTRQAGLLIIANKVLAGVSTILILKATALGDVAVVQALGGLQFVFILIIGMFFSLSSRKVETGEVYHHETFLQKTLFVGVIVIGFLILFT
jgi:membrane protein CcdC involved in cytochrome C biogenesis